MILKKKKKKVNLFLGSCSAAAYISLIVVSCFVTSPKGPKLKQLHFWPIMTTAEPSTPSQVATEEQVESRLEEDLYFHVVRCSNALSGSLSFCLLLIGLDYVSHEDILPYNSAEQVPIQHELFERFLMFNPAKSISFT